MLTQLVMFQASEAVRRYAKIANDTTQSPRSIFQLGYFVKLYSLPTVVAAWPELSTIPIRLTRLSTAVRWGSKSVAFWHGSLLGTFNDWSFYVFSPISSILPAPPPPLTTNRAAKVKHNNTAEKCPRAFHSVVVLFQPPTRAIMENYPSQFWQRQSICVSEGWEKGNGCCCSIVCPKVLYVDCEKSKPKPSHLTACFSFLRVSFVASNDSLRRRWWWRWWHNDTTTSHLHHHGKILIPIMSIKCTPSRIFPSAMTVTWF